MNKLYAISFTRGARKDLDKLDRQIIRRIAPAVDALAAEPRPAGCLKVKSEEQLWRIRVGDYRIGYKVNDATREVIIVKVGHRSEFYE